MATQPAPAGTHSGTLSTDLIREALNPTPAPGAPAGILREWGYLSAMLDALLADTSDGELDPRDFVFIVKNALYYEGCEWHTIEWDEEGRDTLQMLADAIIDADYEV
jgi:hypothetical protein